MSYTYSDRKRAESAPKKSAAPQQSFDELPSAAAVPTQEQMGHRVDLPDAMREKMENAFGADLSAVKLYESDAVKDAGVEAVTQGSNIAFAPGMLDFTSYGGQALLGHEISHVVSQTRGEVTGSGLLNDHALEARADREGAMAASGQQIAMPMEAMSPVSAAAASGPMQCKGKRDSNKKIDNLRRIGLGKFSGAKITDEDQRYYDENVKSLSQKERTMIGKRARQSLRDQHFIFKDLQAEPGHSDDYIRQHLGTSHQDAELSVYTSMLNDFATANNYSGDQRDAEFAAQRKLLTKSDRMKNEELDDFMPDDSTLAKDPEYRRLDFFRKAGLRSYYERTTRG